jgi:hypothetical protein
MIVLSATYCQSSRPSVKAMAIDLKIFYYRMDLPTV